MSSDYDDIIELEHPVSSKHPPMSLQDRAAQFAPFAALTGHNAAIKETERMTQRRVELDDYEKEILSKKLIIIEERMTEYPEISITYFEPDDKKSGGSYRFMTGKIKKIDAYERVICMKDGSKIPMDEIIQIESEFLTKY